MKTTTKRFFAILLTAMLALGVLVPLGAVTAQAADPPAITFYAPETIYIDPTWTTTEFYVNNFTNGSATGASFGSARAVNNESSGYIHFYSQFATNVIITVDDAPAWYYAKGATIASGTAVNLNATLGAGGLGQRSTTTGNATEGLVRWKVTFYDTSRQANFESYCYSYLYRPDRNAVTGAIAHSGLRNESTDPGTLEMWMDSGIYIAGSHLKAGHAYDGSRYASNALVNHMWGAAMTGAVTYTNYAPAAQPNAGDPLGIAMVDMGTKTCVSENSASSLINNATETGGKGYLQVDSSRYTNLSQIPNLQYKYIVNRVDFNTTRIAYTVRGYNATASVRYGNGGFWYTNWYTHTGGSYIQNPTGSASVSMTNPAATGFNTLSTASSYYYVTREGALNKAIANVQGNLDTFSITGGYLWWMCDNETTGNIAHLGEEHVSQHTLTTQLDVWSRDKANLRSQLQTETNLGLQAEDYTPASWAAYRAALEELTAALCNPAHDFANAALDLDAVTVTGSLANKVYIARINLAVPTFQLRFFDGVSGLPSVFTIRKGAEFKFSAVIPTPYVRPGYELMGWSVTAGAAKPDYKIDGTLTVNGGADFHAVWGFSQNTSTGRVTVSPAGAFTKPTTMGALEWAPSTMSGYYGAIMFNCLVSYDITFAGYSDADYPLATPVTVRIEVPDWFPESELSRLIVRHVRLNDRNNYDDYVCTPVKIDGKWYIEFETDHFSIYALGYETPTAPDWNGKSQVFTYKKGNTFTLALPQGVTVREWKTSNAKTATVAGGKITLRMRGNATITAVFDDNTAWTYKVTVKFNFLHWLLYILCFGWLWMS